MAIFKGGPNSPFSGKAGSVIGSNWRKIYYIKGLSKRIKPESPEQLRQQQKWHVMGTFLAPIRIILELGYNKIDKSKKTALNIAMSYHVKWALAESEDGFKVAFERVLISKGRLPKATDAKVSADVPGKILFSWSPVPKTSLVSTEDKATILIYNEQKEAFMINSDGEPATRRLGGLSIDVPQGWDNDVCHCYIFFTSPGGNNSPSYYLGEITLKEKKDPEAHM